MKKILLSALGLLGLVGTAFAGNGTKENPYTVDDVVDLFAADSKTDLPNVYVQGYIVGSIPTTASMTWIDYAEFSAKDASASNLVLGGSSAENDYKFCMTIQLPSGSDVRKAMNLKDNPNALGHEVILCGQLIKYCSGPGLKEPSFFEWVGEAPEAGGGNTGSYATGSADAPLTVTELLAQGTPGSAVPGTYLTGYIVGYVHSNPYYYVYTAENCNVATNILLAATANETDSIKCVPIQLPSGDVRTGLNLQDNPSNLGKEVTLYGSHQAYFNNNGMQAVKNYWWGSKGETVDTPAVPDAPTGVINVAKAIELVTAGYSGNAQVEGYITQIDQVDLSTGNALYWISDDTNASNKLEVYWGKYLNGANFTAENQIEVGAKVTVEGIIKLYGSTPEFDKGSKIISYNGETVGGGDTPENPENPGPGDDAEGVTQEFTKGIGFPEAAGEAPKEETSYTASNTGIIYDVLGCYCNSGYLMINGKNFNGESYISWSLDFPCSYFLITTTSGCSTNAASTVNIYANGEAIQSNFGLNQQSHTYSVAIPEEYQKAGTTYMIKANTDKYNQQIASILYVDASKNAVEEIIVDGGEAVYFNLQGVQVANPDHGIYIKVAGGKATKVIL